MGRLVRKGPLTRDPGVTLGPLNVLGRDADCSVRDDVAAVSRHHAQLRFSEGRWLVRDMNSSNGTFIDGVDIGTEERELLEGQLLQLGEDGAVWLFESAYPPVPCAIALDSPNQERIIGEGMLLGLPDPHAPSHTIMRDESGWVLESDDDQLRVQDGDAVTVMGRKFVLELPANVRSTETTISSERDGASALALEFRVSQDREHVVIVPRVGRQQLKPLSSRAHHALLLHLAELRVEDQRSGLSEKEAGWVDVRLLQEALKLDEAAINVLVFRARRAFDQHGVPHAGNVIERRTGSGQLRLGTGRVVLAQH